MSPFVKPEKKGFNLDGYVEVKERIALFYAAFPDGRLVTSEVMLHTDAQNKQRIQVKALAYRTPEDTLPAVGHSWMELPGTTSYTRGSELENTETSAWGRAIGALGIGIKGGIASKEEVAGKERDEAAEAFDAGLVGTAEVGKGDADFELRQTPTGWVLIFRLTEGRTGIKVIARDGLAEQINEYRKGIEGQRVTCWGSVTEQTFTPKGAPKPVTYSVLNLARIKVGVLDLAEPDHEPSEDEDALIAELGDATFGPALVAS